MLTPCMVTTFHTGPSYFQYLSPSRDWETLSDFIDLLVIDEAGQVAPHLSSAMISIAKKVLIVGDTHQIEPVMTLSEGIDLANSKKHGLCTNEKEFDAIKKLGILCSGNPHTLKGMVLEEHWRCAPKIIRFCNELCYENKLIPMKKKKSYILPRMGYAHIKGEEEKVGASRKNPLEALVITLSQQYGLTIKKIGSVLNESFVWAEKKLTIVSPFLRTRAIEKDDICNLITQFKSKIDITIYSGPYLNKGAYESDYHAARKMLKKAGARVFNVKNVHSKIIAVDEKIIVEGSFNWLSASRVTNQYQREETSILYSGPKVARFIKESLGPIKERILKY